MIIACNGIPLGSERIRIPLPRKAKLHSQPEAEPFSLTFKSSLIHTAVATAFWLACAVVATLSLLPVNELPSIALNLWDKAQHASGFFLLGVLGLLAYPHQFSRVLIGLLLFGALIEMAQAASGWRTGDVLDWLADSTGLALAALAMTLQPSARR